MRTATPRAHVDPENQVGIQSLRELLGPESVGSRELDRAVAGD